ncbi:MAG TPA: hypothetical protein VGP77_14075 [Vicinamibacterales bacterium]|nr:hypothetical protein [Vicinamibacterales bacterium]
MRVRIVDAGDDDASADVDDLGIRGRARSDRCRAADGADAIAVNHHRLGPGCRRVGREYLAVDEQQIDSVRLRRESDNRKRGARNREEATI